MNLTNITSPLTIIALLAALVEASALASLPFLDPASQGVYIWFLVGFPPFLTVLFFITLNFNAKALFSPSSGASLHVQSAETSAADITSPTTTSENSVMLIGDTFFCKLAEREFQQPLELLVKRHGIQARIISCNTHPENHAQFSDLARRHR